MEISCYKLWNPEKKGMESLKYWKKKGGQTRILYPEKMSFIHESEVKEVIAWRPVLHKTLSRFCRE